MDEIKNRKEGIAETKKVFDIVKKEKDHQKYDVQGVYIPLATEDKK